MLIRRHVQHAVMCLALIAAARDASAGETEPAIDDAWKAEAEETATAIREAILMGVEVGLHESVYVEFGGSLASGTVVGASERGVDVKTRIATISLPWKRITPRRLYLIGKKYIPDDDAYMRLRLGKYCAAHGLYAEAREELIAASSLNDEMRPQARAALEVVDGLASAGTGTRESKPSDRKPATPKLLVSGKTAEVLTKLGRAHFMLGITSGPGDKWLKETKQQGCAWDMRYQYLAGGVNKPHNWKTWNQPAGAFARSYLSESDAVGVIPVFSWYQMYQSLPGGGAGDEAETNKKNSETVDTMRQYLSDIKLFMEVAGKHGKPAILHVEPDLWGFYLINAAFRPNDPDSIRVMVKSTGIPELAKYEDTMAGFGRAIVGLRDMYAPNVLLGWHASHWGSASPQKAASAIAKCGNWDIVFVDPSDRDSAWKVAHGYHANGAWWKDSDFATFRNWCGQIHKASGLPIIVWQIPVGNTIMAACNNTEGHFMDNRPQHWLEGYPKNAHIMEWAASGIIALLFGGGAGGCTYFGDGCKDGITNPTPVEGNSGEESKFSDDDGGYLRTRSAKYYRSPLRFEISKPAKQRR